MYNYLKSFNTVNNCYSYSIFSDFGDLSQYTLDKLMLLATDFKITSEIINNQILTKWRNVNSNYEILYTLSGSFIKIKSETWLDLNLHFNK
jgi:hypothetical protein